MKTETDERLRQILLTADGLGREKKTLALEEILNRKRSERWFSYGMNPQERIDYLLGENDRLRKEIAKLMR